MGDGITVPLGLTNEITTYADPANTFKDVGVVGEPESSKINMTNEKIFMQGSEVLANTAYKDRVKTKVLWTGPLSVVSTPTSLDGGEAFSPWDLILIQFHGLNDASISNPNPYIFPTSLLSSLDMFTDTGQMRFNKLSDTSFELQIKTVAAGNISRIIGISL